MSRFGALLRQLRQQAGMTQEQLEEHSGVSVRTIRRFETTEHANAGMATVRLLADALRLTPGERDGLLAAAIGAPLPTAPRQLPAPPGEFVGRHGEPAALDKALNAAGWSAAGLGEHDTAREHCEAALALHREHHNADGEADTLDSLGYIAHQTGDDGQAVTHYRQALTLFRDLDYTYEAAGTLERLGHPLVALGQHDQARAVWQEALEIYQAQQRTADALRIQSALDSVISRNDRC